MLTKSPRLHRTTPSFVLSVGACLLILAMCASARAETPAPIAGWIDSLPQEAVGTFYAKVKPPIGPAIWLKINAWGQLCDGTDQAGYVSDQLYNDTPHHGRGWTYLAWRCKRVQSGPSRRPTSGIVPPNDSKP